jgi:hypothetical protein
MSHEKCRLPGRHVGELHEFIATVVRKKSERSNWTCNNLSTPYKSQDSSLLCFHSLGIVFPISETNNSDVIWVYFPCPVGILTPFWFLHLFHLR